MVVIMCGSGCDTVIPSDGRKRKGALKISDTFASVFPTKTRSLTQNNLQFNPICKKINFLKHVRLKQPRLVSRKLDWRGKIGVDFR